PEHRISRGRLLPAHELLDRQIDPAHAARFAESLAGSLILIHGGMAQNVGPILNMVTAKYLLRSRPEWEERQEALRIFDRIVSAVQEGNIRALGEETTKNWE